MTDNISPRIKILNNKLNHKHLQLQLVKNAIKSLRELEVCQEQEDYDYTVSIVTVQPIIHLLDVEKEIKEKIETIQKEINSCE